MATNTPELTAETRQDAEQRLTNLRWDVDRVLREFDDLINLPGMPRREVTILKEQRTKMGKTAGVILGVKARLNGSEQ